MKNKNILFITIFVALIVAVYFLSRKNKPANDQTISQAPVNQGTENTPAVANNSGDVQNSANNIMPDNSSKPVNGFLPPLDRAAERVTKKPFGIFITPQTSPVQPERFRGYHTGTDFEIFPEELNADVPVKAVCDGKLLVVRTASGYGGLAVESCELNGQPITVVYGHLNIASVRFKVGDQIKAGDTLAFLGAAYSAQTDGERKHLHLGFHKGSSVSILGYVQSQAELSGWLDPCDYVCK